MVVANPDGQWVTLVGAFTYTAPSGPDFDGDGIVGFSDFLVLAGAFGSREGDVHYDPRCDLTGDGRIDFDDFLTFVQSFGKRS